MPTKATPQPWNPPAGTPQPDRPAAARVPAQPVPAYPVAMLVSGPWRGTGLFGDAWPGPGRPAAPAAAGLLIVAALLAALTITGGGVGWLVATLAGGAALAGIRRLPAPRSTVPWPELSGYRRHNAVDPVRYAWAAATVALVGIGTLRAAPWLFTLAVLTALATAGLAMAGGRSARAMMMAVVMFLGAPFRALPWVTRGLAGIRRRGAGTSGIRIVATVVTSIFLLLLFGALFASADPAFARLLESMIPEANGPTAFRTVFVFVVAGGVFGGAAYLRAAPPALSAVDVRTATKVNRWEWSVPLGLLALLFFAFVGVQLTVLFGGSEHVLATDGLTYAEYARSGFWQLLIVTGLTLAVLGVAARWAPRDTRTDRLLIRVIMGALSVLTLVIVASALHRMTVYADMYGLTRLRILVFLCEAWLGTVFVMILLAGIRMRATWLPRIALGLGVLTLLGLAVANPDAMIARSGIERFERTGRIDTPYLSGLSADALPELNRLERRQRDCTTIAIQQRLRLGDRSWRVWNYGESRARRILATDPSGPTSGCY